MSETGTAVHLQDYDRHGRILSMDTGTGGVLAASGRLPDLCHGFVHFPAAVQDRHAAALYGLDGRLWLQYGGRRWDCERVSAGAEELPGGMRAFTVAHPDAADAAGAPAPSPADTAGLPGVPSATELRLLYPAPRPEPFDPSYDWTDVLADDFFLWAANRLADADGREALRHHFLAGFPPG